MSVTEAFWTLRILPRIGSSAWCSLLRASLAVPSALSPSTMNSSVRSTSVAAAVGELGGQRRGLEGGLAALGLLVQPRADPRLHLGGDLLEEQRGLLLVGPLGRREAGAVSSVSTTRETIAAHGVGAEDLLGLALELRLGETHRDHRGEALEGVVLLELVAADLEPPGVDLELPAQHLEQGLLEPGEVGAALGGGDDVDERGDPGVVAGAPAHGDVDAALALDLGGRHVALVVEHGDGLPERAAALEAPDAA